MSIQQSAISNQQSAVSSQQKLDEVRRLLLSFKRVIVAYSGGVDSTLLAKLARDTLGKPNALAVTADSPSLAREDLAVARQLAAELDLEHLIIVTRELEDASYRANAPSRCYVCKQTLFVELERLARERANPPVLYGAIGDDEAAQRPGQQAAREARVRAPLQEAGLSKGEVRQLARSLGLPNWDRPQNACLSSRIPHGIEVTAAKLTQIEAAEAVLRAEGFGQVRVRHHGAHARIEVEHEAVGRLSDAGLRARIAEAFAQIGFETVGVERAGYRPGGANLSPSDELMLSNNT